MSGTHSSKRSVFAGAAAGTLVALLAACATESAGGAGRATSLGSMFSGRPRVSVSVAEVHPGSGVEQLDFFDALEKRDLVTHDDSLHAALLLFAGQSGQTFVQRAGRAKQMGLLDEDFDRPPREAVRIGELSLILAAGLHRTGAGSESQAVAELKEIGVLPEFAEANSGVSGAQLLTILGHTEDALAANPPTPPSAPIPAGDGALRPATPDEREHAAAGVFQPAGDKRPVRKPPIDLEEEAKKPRPGQVLPDGAPARPSPGAAPANPPSAPAPSPTPTPATPPATPPAAPPAIPSPTMPDPSPRPLPPPLPRPHADAGAPSRLDGIASDLRYVAVDRVEVEATEVLGPSEFVQWRSVDDGRGRPGDWHTLQPGEAINERVEIRTGLGVRASIKVGEGTNVVLHRLSRARLERKIRSDGHSQLGITIYRGVVEAGDPESATGAGSDQGRAPIYVKTPDQVFPLRARALFEYDAFQGTLAREFRP